LLHDIIKENLNVCYCVITRQLACLLAGRGKKEVMRLVGSHGMKLLDLKFMGMTSIAWWLYKAQGTIVMLVEQMKKLQECLRDHDLLSTVLLPAQV